jgi:hypothetical protein
MDIREFRNKYPQYDSLSDDQLSRSVWNKWYKEKLDYDTFSRRFGVTKTVPQQVKETSQSLKEIQSFIAGGEKGNIPKDVHHPFEYDLMKRINRGELSPEDQYVVDMREIYKKPGTQEYKDKLARERTAKRLNERIDEITAKVQVPDDQKRRRQAAEEQRQKFIGKTWNRVERGTAMVVGGGLWLADQLTYLPAKVDPYIAKPLRNTVKEWNDRIRLALDSSEMQPVIDNTFDKYFGGAVETGPFLAAAIAPAVLSGGATLPSSLGGFLVAYGVEGNNIEQAALNQSKSWREARVRGIVGGVINGGIEIVGGHGGKYVKPLMLNKVATKIGKARYFSRRVLTTALAEGLKEELPQEAVAMILGADPPRNQDGSIDWYGAAKRLVDAGIMGTIIGGAFDVPFSAYGVSKLPDIGKQTAVSVGNGRIAAPGAVYAESRIRAEESGNTVNPWVRLNDKPGNAGRTLMMQFSSDLITKEEDPAAKSYYDKLYSTRPGYSRLGDTWEVPKWMGEIAHTVPDSDVYFVRDMAEAKEFLAKSGYDHIAFSALDVNKDHIKELAKDFEGDVSIGGYIDLKYFDDVKNAKTYKDVKEMTEDRGLEYKEGTNYTHFEGSRTIPRLCMSKGCLHKCAFCVVPKGVSEMSPEIMDMQADEIAKMDAKLVYLDDKTFGQSKNHDQLIRMYDRIKKKNPDFEGFIIQTTAAQMGKLDEQMMRDSHIKFVEIGVESYNDDILKANKKPANRKLIDAAANKARKLGVDLIPNIIIGLPQETAESYANTLQWIEDNADIISHLNIYNLALYEGTELAKSVGEKATLDDLNENKIKKSFHKEPEIHAAAAAEFYKLGSELLDTPLINDRLAPRTVDETIGAQYGFTSLQVNDILTKAEDRYRELKNKPVKKRSADQRKELAFLSRKRGDIEALIGDITSDKPLIKKLWKKPKLPSKKVLFRKGHQIPEQMGLTNEQRQNLMEIATGKRSMAEMSKEEMNKWVNYIEAELAARGETYVEQEPILPKLINQLRAISKQEAIAGAAIKLASGEMLTNGRTHGEILQNMAATGRKITNEEFTPDSSGFLTNRGKFVQPKEAYRIADKAGQIKSVEEGMLQEWIDRKHLVAEGIKFYAPGRKNRILNNRVTEYFKSKLSGLHSDFVRIERWLERLDGYERGPLHDTIWKRVKNADELRKVMISQNQEAFFRLIEESGNDATVWSGAKEQIVPGIELTPFEKIGVFLLAQNKHGFRYLTRGMAFSEEDIQAVEDALTEQELAIAEWLDQEYRAQWPVVRAAAMDVGIDPKVLEEELNYSPIMRTDYESEQDFVTLLAEQFNRQSLKPDEGFIKKRTEAVGKLELDAGVIYMVNVQRIETFKAMAPIARDLGKIFNNPEFKQAFNSATDENGMKILNQWLRDTIKGHLDGPRTKTAKIISTMRRNGIIYAIGWNIPSSLRQTLSGFNAMAVDPKMPKYMIDNLYKATSSKDGYKDIREFVISRSNLVRTRAYDRDLRRKWDAGRLAKRLQGKKPFDEKAVRWIRWMDDHTVTIAWKSMYDVALERGMAEDQAIEFADQNIARTQPMADMKDLPHFFRGGTIERLLSTFQNQINNNYNFYTHDIIGKWAAGKISSTEAGYRIMFSIVMPAILYGMIGRGRLPEDWKEVGVDIGTYPIASLMIVGRWITRMINGWSKSGTVGEIAPEEAIRAFNAAKRGDIRGIIQHGAAAIGAATGKIPAQAIRTTSGALDLISGTTDDPRRLVYTQWALEQSKEKKSTGKRKRLIGAPK